MLRMSVEEARAAGHLPAKPKRVPSRKAQEAAALVERVSRAQQKGPVEFDWWCVGPEIRTTDGKVVLRPGGCGHIGRMTYTAAERHIDEVHGRSGRLEVRDPPVTGSARVK